MVDYYLKLESHRIRTSYGTAGADIERRVWLTPVITFELGTIQIRWRDGRRGTPIGHMNRPMFTSQITLPAFLT